MAGKFEHLVVVMLENRSFDNLLGWLYGPDNDPKYHRPQRNIPPQSPPVFDGLEKHKYWNETGGPHPTRVYATRGTTGPHPYHVPSPDPQELFDHMNFQQFESDTPAKGAPASMTGFLKDYETVANNPDPKQIMECYSPEQVPVLTALARNYAVCDRWFGSAPCQTWPNRAFLHAGTSCGRVNNCNDNHDNCLPDPLYYDTPTIFNVLHGLGHSWRIYNDTFLPSLVRMQFIEHLGSPLLDDHFHGFERFKEDARKGKLPAYSFIEPSFLIEPNDQHPPHDIIPGEKFLFDIWSAVSAGRKWKSTLLVITYDEHGGCYDHRGPLWTATRPDNSPPQQPFGFDRWGPRVPAVLVSPYIEPGTVFRSPSPDVDYDHTSILATLRDWLRLPEGKMLKSDRIKKAPTLFGVLTRNKPRRDLPVIKAPKLTDDMTKPSERPLNSNQKAVLAAMVLKRRNVAEADRASVLDALFLQVKTEADAVSYIRRQMDGSI